jgi:predicted regulator of Ras-like GTPase activity (Roadblock/LC7/MglB family)
MELILREINIVVGVAGSFFCLSDGSLVATTMPASFTATQLEKSALVASQTFYALETYGQRVTEADLIYDSHRLLLKNLLCGILAILCARNINLPLLNLTINEAAKKITAELKPQATQDAITSSTAGLSVAVPNVAVAEVLPGLILETARSNNVITPGCIDIKFFDELTRELVLIMGATAHFVIDDEMHELGETRANFPQVRVVELVERISGSIRDEPKRARFRQIILKALHKR